MVSRPANLDAFESHNGAETMPVLPDFASQPVIPWCVVPIDGGLEGGEGRGHHVPFWMRMFKLSLTESEVSKMMSRKLRGRTS